MEEGKENVSTQKKGFWQIIRDSFKELKDTFVALAKAPRALWGINIPYVVEGLVYFGILTVLGKFCSENVGLSDLHSGWVYGGVTGGITFAMLLFGGLSDKIGVRFSLWLSLAIMMAGRALVSISGTIPLGSGISSPMFMLMAFGLLLMVAAYGLYQPAAYAGVKRYTNPQTAAVGYGMIYALMNLGAFLSGFVSPLTRHTFDKIFPPNGLTAVFWVYTILTLVSILVTLLILTKRVDKNAVERVAKETLEMNKNGKGSEKKEEPAAEPKKEPVKINNTLFLILLAPTVIFLALFVYLLYLDLPLFSAPGPFQSSHPKPFAVSYIGLALFALLAILEFFRKRPEHPFRNARFVFFIFALMPVQTLFAHNWLTIPYYLDRAFVGSTVSKYFELFSNLNPIIIFVLTPIIAAMTARANVYKMMIIGTLVMAVPTFMLCAGPNAVIFVLYILLMSVGEAIWSPRFLQWVAEIAPEGKVGMYMGIGQFPWFLTKMVTAAYSGYFVATYIPKPETGLAVHSETMWLWYSIIAMVTPVVLWLARGWMSKGMKNKA